jgi:FXSXX-COOH protein
MKATNEVQSSLSSVLLDLRQVPLAAVPALGNVTLSDAIGRVVPESSVGQVPVAAFQSAI